MPIINTDIKQRLSGGAANAVADASIGGAKSSNDAPAGLFDTVTGAESAAGDTEYRCIYVHNNHGTLTLVGAKIWVDANPSAQINIGLGVAAVNATETAIANESTAPASVTFTASASEGAALTIGDIPAGQHKAVWLRRIVAAAAPAAAVTYSLTVKGDTAA